MVDVPAGGWCQGGEAVAAEIHPKMKGGGTPLPLHSSHSIIFYHCVPLITPWGKPADVGVGNTGCSPSCAESSRGKGMEHCQGQAHQGQEHSCYSILSPHKQSHSQVGIIDNPLFWWRNGGLEGLKKLLMGPKSWYILASNVIEVLPENWALRSCWDSWVSLKKVS